jgi:transposase
MPRAYSQDLRDRVIDMVIREGETRRAAARRFGVSEASADKWLRRYERAGDRHSLGPGGRRPALARQERAWLLATIAAEPDITLGALSDRLRKERGVAADPATLSRFFVREGINFTKLRATLKAGAGLRSSPTRAFESNCDEFNPDDLAFFGGLFQRQQDAHSST